MAESDADKLSRVQLMASGSETWDLSRNDVAALKYVLVSLAAAESALSAVARERDEMATALVAANERAESMEALFQRTHGCHHSWVEEATRQRTRAEQAEAERDEARAAWDGWQERYCAVVREREEARDRRDAALAEVARLRGEYERGLREAAALAHKHGGISAYYAITKLAAEVEPAAEVSDG